VRKLALEWLWCMMSDSRRLALRYLACLAILPRYTLQALRLRLSDPRPTRPSMPVFAGTHGGPPTPAVPPGPPMPRLVSAGREALPVAPIFPRDGLGRTRGAAPNSSVDGTDRWADMTGGQRPGGDDAPGHDDTPRSGPQRASG
jgi:hypothetical protein